jgi:DeoR family glycerol-3-phosphate regulon repressor
MKAKSRQTQILAFIRDHDRATVEDLARKFQASRETIRRDLTELDKHGKVHKFHGGAALPRRFGESAFQQRMTENTVAKTRIAKTAAKLFSPSETLFIDTGSTTLIFAEHLAATTGLNIITNSTDIATALAPTHPGTTLLGGTFNPANNQTTGPDTIEQINGVHAHHAVLTVGALDAATGASDFDRQESHIARAMIARARAVTLLADASKFTALASFAICPLAGISRLVCDAPPPTALATALDRAGVKTLIA